MGGVTPKSPFSERYRFFGKDAGLLMEMSLISSPSRWHGCSRPPPWLGFCSRSAKDVLWYSSRGVTSRCQSVGPHLWQQWWWGSSTMTHRIGKLSPLLLRMSRLNCLRDLDALLATPTYYLRTVSFIIACVLWCNNHTRVSPRVYGSSQITEPQFVPPPKIKAKNQGQNSGLQ